MYFANQKAYEEYHSPAQRRIRAEEARKTAESAVSEALSFFKSGDTESARQRLFDAGISDDGIAYYLHEWVR